MTSTPLRLALAFATLLAAAAARAEDSVLTVDTIAGSVTVERDGKRLSPKVGDALQEQVLLELVARRARQLEDQRLVRPGGEWLRTLHRDRHPIGRHAGCEPHVRAAASSARRAIAESCGRKRVRHRHCAAVAGGRGWRLRALVTAEGIVAGEVNAPRPVP